VLIGYGRGGERRVGCAHNVPHIVKGKKRHPHQPSWFVVLICARERGRGRLPLSFAARPSCGKGGEGRGRKIKGGGRELLTLLPSQEKKKKKKRKGEIFSPCFLGSLGKKKREGGQGIFALSVTVTRGEEKKRKGEEHHVGDRLERKKKKKRKREKKSGGEFLACSLSRSAIPPRKKGRRRGGKKEEKRSRPLYNFKRNTVCSREGRKEKKKGKEKKEKGAPFLPFFFPFFPACVPYLEGEEEGGRRKKKRRKRSSQSSTFVCTLPGDGGERGGRMSSFLSSFPLFSPPIKRGKGGGGGGKGNSPSFLQP